MGSLQRVRGGFSRRFLIDGRSRRFRSACSAVLHLKVGTLGTPSRGLLLRDRVRGLLTLMGRGLRGRRPGVRTLAFCCRLKSSRRLTRLPPARGLRGVACFCRHRFQRPVLLLLRGKVSHTKRLGSACRTTASQTDEGGCRVLRILFSKRPRRVLRRLVRRWERE